MKTNSAGRHNLLRYDMLWLGGGSHRFNVFKFGTLSQTGTYKKNHMTYTFQTTCFFLSHFLLSKPPLKGEKNSQVAVSHTKLDVALKPNASKISDLFAKTTKGSWSKHTYVYIYIYLEAMCKYINTSSPWNQQIWKIAKWPGCFGLEFRPATVLRGWPSTNRVVMAGFQVYIL